MNSSPLNTTEEQPGGILMIFGTWYWGIHGYFSLIVCTFGILTNIVNIIVLTRKRVRSSINCILTGIAIADILTMTSYVPFAVHFYIQHGLERTPEKYTYGWNLFLVFHLNTTTTMHTISIWLAVFLAILRYTFIWTKGRGERNLSMHSTTLFVCLIYALSALLTVPNYLTHMVVEHRQPGSNGTTYRLGSTDSPTLNTANFWLIAFVGKLVPCLLIAIFGGLLLQTLRETKQRTKILRSSSVGQRVRQHSRTTRMLLSIIVLFIVTELPQGILVVISGIDDGFFNNVYIPLGDFMDILALINNAINFIFYCTMSQQFRSSFVDLLHEVGRATLGRYFRCEELGKEMTATTV